MGRVAADVVVEVRASEAEALWYDTRRWPSFVDGLAHVDKVEGDWPREGRVLWDAKPGGRGRVLERVLAYEQREGQTVHVEDETMRGTQRVTFTPQAGGCKVGLVLEYELKQQRPAMGLVDWLFIRRPMRDALRRTLVRLKRELEAGDVL